MVDRRDTPPSEPPAQRGVPVTDLRPPPEVLEPKDDRPDSSRALDKAAKLLLESLKNLSAHQLDGIPIATRLALAAKLELAVQARKQTDLGKRSLDMTERELDAQIERRVALLRPSVAS
jgi:hypothetical protein